MLALSRDDVHDLVPMTTAIELMKQVFADLSAGKTASPLRVPLEIPEREAVTLFMPASVPSAGGLGIKIVSVFPQNTTQGKPTIHAVVVMVSTETGEPLALLDGTYLTALRTGAVSGAATDLLARPDSRILTVVGAGAQGVTQAWAVGSVRPIERVYVADLNPASVASFAERLRALDAGLAAKVVVAEDAAAAVAESDVICTATSSRRGVFPDAAVRPGTHINAIGAFTPEMQEIPAETVARATIVVDAVDAAMAEAGDLLVALNEGAITRDRIATELGQIASGEAPGRTSDQEITLFKSVGNAVQDVIVAQAAVVAAEAAGRGQRIVL